MTLTPPNMTLTMFCIICAYSFAGNYVTAKVVEDLVVLTDTFVIEQSKCVSLEFIPIRSNPDAVKSFHFQPGIDENRLVMVSDNYTCPLSEELDTYDCPDQTLVPKFVLRVQPHVYMFSEAEILRNSNVGLCSIQIGCVENESAMSFCNYSEGCESPPDELDSIGCREYLLNATELQIRSKMWSSWTYLPIDLSNSNETLAECLQVSETTTKTISSGSGNSTSGTRCLRQRPPPFIPGKTFYIIISVIAVLILGFLVYRCFAWRNVRRADRIEWERTHGEGIISPYGQDSEYDRNEDRKVAGDVLNSIQTNCMLRWIRGFEILVEAVGNTVPVLMLIDAVYLVFTSGTATLKNSSEFGYLVVYAVYHSIILFVQFLNGIIHVLLKLRTLSKDPFIRRTNSYYLRVWFVTMGTYIITDIILLTDDIITGIVLLGDIEFFKPWGDSTVDNSSSTINNVAYFWPEGTTSQAVVVAIIMKMITMGALVSFCFYYLQYSGSFQMDAITHDVTVCIAVLVGFVSQGPGVAVVAVLLVLSLVSWGVIPAIVYSLWQCCQGFVGTSMPKSLQPFVPVGAKILLSCLFLFVLFTAMVFVTTMVAWISGYDAELSHINTWDMVDILYAAFPETPQPRYFANLAFLLRCARIGVTTFKAIVNNIRKRQLREVARISLEYVALFVDTLIWFILHAIVNGLELNAEDSRKLLRLLEERRQQLQLKKTQLDARARLLQDVLTS